MLLKVLALAAALFAITPVLADVPIDIGESATVRLSPQGELTYPVSTALPHAPANHGALLTFDVEDAARYHVSISAPGWIDVVRDGKALAPADDRLGAAGTGIAKVMDYDLAPGRYTLALSAMVAGEITVKIAP